MLQRYPDQWPAVAFIARVIWLQPHPSPVNLAQSIPYLIRIVVCRPFHTQVISYNETVPSNSEQIIRNRVTATLRYRKKKYTGSNEGVGVQKTTDGKYHRGGIKKSKNMKYQYPVAFAWLGCVIYQLKATLCMLESMLTIKQRGRILSLRCWNKALCQLATSARQNCLK